jgi:hypothetical protein
MFDDYDGGDDAWKGRRGRGRGASEWWQGWRIKNGHVDEDEQAQEKRGGASGRSPSAVPLRPSGGATYKPTCLTPLDSSHFHSHPRVETPIHDNIRELVTWECKEHGVKS